MPEDTLNPTEAAAYLKVNPQTIYRNLRRGRLPGNKIGRQWRIRKKDLDRYLAGASLAAEEAVVWVPSPRPEPATTVTRTRRALLQKELTRFIRVVREKIQPRQILVYGSFAHGNLGEWSDLDLVVVADTDQPFYERSKVILNEVRPVVGMDVLVYTPAEWDEMKDRPFIKEEVLRKGRVVYER